MEHKTNGLVYVLQTDKQSMPIRLVWDSCLGPGMLLVLLPSPRRCRIHKALLTNRDAVTLGENNMTCVKTWLLKCYKNPDTAAIKNKFANVPTSWKFRGFWSLSLSRKSQVNVFHFSSTTHKGGELRSKYAKKHVHYYIRNVRLYHENPFGVSRVVTCEQAWQRQQAHSVTLLQKRQNWESW